MLFQQLLLFIKFFSKKYPLISLRYKEKRLKHYFEIKKYPGLRTKKGGDERKNKIIKSLKENAKTINQLSKQLLVLPRVLRRHLNVLLKEKKVKSLMIQIFQSKH